MFDYCDRSFESPGGHGFLSLAFVVWRTDHSFRALPSVCVCVCVCMCVCNCVWYKSLKNKAAYAWYLLLRRIQIKVDAALPLRRYTKRHKNVANVLPPLQQTAVKR
jgi:hypothetical protein